MIEIDIKGPKGNAFFLIGYAKKLANDLDLDANAIAEEMKESDYDHLISVFEKYFSDFVVLLK